MIEYNEKESGFKKILIIILIVIAGVVILNKNMNKTEQLGKNEFKIPALQISQSFKSRSEMKSMISNHFKDKYGENIIEFLDDGNKDEMFSKEIRFYLNTTSEPENYYIYAIYNTDTNEILDNYFDFTMKDKVQDKLSSIIDTVYPNNYMEYTTHGHILSNDVKGDLTFEEYMSIIDYPLEITIIIPIEIGNEYELESRNIKIYELESKLKKQNIRCTLEIAYAYDYAIEANIPIDIEDIFYNEEVYLIKGRFYQNENLQYDDLTWEQSKNYEEQLESDYTVEPINEELTYEEYTTDW